MHVPEIYCAHCYQYQAYTGQSHCANPKSGFRLSNWHVAKQLKADSHGAKVREVHPVREVRPGD